MGILFVLRLARQAVFHGQSDLLSFYGRPKFVTIYLYMCASQSNLVYNFHFYWNADVV